MPKKVPFLQRQTFLVRYEASFFQYGRHFQPFERTCSVCRGYVCDDHPAGAHISIHNNPQSHNPARVRFFFLFKQGGVSKSTAESVCRSLFDIFGGHLQKIIGPYDDKYVVFVQKDAAVVV